MPTATTKASTITTTSHHIELLTDNGIRIEATIVIAERGRIDSCVIRGCSEWYACSLNIDLYAMLPIYQFPARAVCSAARALHSMQSSIKGRNLDLTDAGRFVIENIREGISMMLVEHSFLLASQTKRDHAQCLGIALSGRAVAGITVEITTTTKSI